MNRHIAHIQLFSERRGTDEKLIRRRNDALLQNIA